MIRALRHPALLGLLTLVLTAATCLVVAWDDLVDLRKSRVWSYRGGATLAGATVFIEASDTLIFPERPDRALVYLRLRLEGSTEDLQAWLTCNPVLIDPKGRRWSALYNQLGIDAVAAMGKGGSLSTSRSCSQSLTRDPAISEQAYLVPRDSIGTLSLEISGLRTYPEALLMPLTLQTELPLLRQH